MTTTGETRRETKRSALRFVVLLGLVSLLADVTYEGARSVTGPFLAVLGASAVGVGFIAGLGELVGYGLRLVSGYLSDRTRRYWTLTLTGYVVNLGAVPLLALAGRWQIAAALIVAERLGKAIRTPARDAMLSHATSQIGRGWGFGLHEAMDQTGAMLGPLIVAGVIALRGDYRDGFAVLAIPALLAVAVLVAARFIYPTPSNLEPQARAISLDRGLPRTYWVYLAAVAFIALGYADFPLVAYHFEHRDIVTATWIPVLYSVAMGVDGLAALVFGRLFDRIGLRSLALAVVASALFAPLVFLGGPWVAVAGVVLWGVGMGAQESIMRAAVGAMVPSDRRGTAYGLFNAGFGLAWFLGSVAIGALYDWRIGAAVAFSVVAQLLAVPLLANVWSGRRQAAA